MDIWIVIGAGVTVFAIIAGVHMSLAALRSPKRRMARRLRRKGS